MPLLSQEHGSPYNDYSVADLSRQHGVSTISSQEYRHHSQVNFTVGWVTGTACSLEKVMTQQFQNVYFGGLVVTCSSYGKLAG